GDQRGRSAGWQRVPAGAGRRADPPGPRGRRTRQHHGGAGADSLEVIMRATAAITMLLVSLAPLAAQRGKETASDLFHSEVGLIVSPKASRNKFQTARKSTVSIMLGLRYRLWKVTGSQTADLDPDGAGLRPGDLLRLGLEI